MYVLHLSIADACYGNGLVYRKVALFRWTIDRVVFHIVSVVFGIWNNIGDTLPHVFRGRRQVVTALSVLCNPRRSGLGVCRP